MCTGMTQVVSTPLATMEGPAFEGHDCSTNQRDILAEIWGAAKLTQQGIAPSESDGICRLSYDAPNDPPHLAFYCKSRFGD